MVLRQRLTARVLASPAGVWKAVEEWQEVRECVYVCVCVCITGVVWVEIFAAVLGWCVVVGGMY